MPGLQLPISVGISATGVETFNRIQSAIAGVGGTAETQAAAGLRALSLSLGESATAAGAFKSPMVALGTQMDGILARGEITPVTLGQVAQSIEEVRESTIRGTQALQGINAASLDYDTVLSLLTAKERAFVEALAIGSKSLLSWSAQLWQAQGASARLTSGIEETAGASAASVETLNRVQSALAGVGWTADVQAAAGLQALVRSLRESASAANVASPSMSFLGATMTAVGDSGKATPVVLGQLAQSMETVRASALKNALALQGVNVASLEYKTALTLLTDEERTFIETLTTGSKMLLSWSDQLQRMGQTTRRVQETTAATKGATKATKALSVTSRRTSGIMGIFSSSMQGLMLVFSALSGSIKGVLFSLIFLGYGVWPITLAVAALGITFAGITKAIVTTGRSIEQLRLKLDLLAGSLEQGYAAWRQTLYWSTKTGRSFEDVSETLRVLHENGLLFQSTIEAAFNLAAARGMTAAEAAKTLATAIGEEQENLESLRTVGIRVDRDLIDTTDRRTVAEAAALAVLERYPGAYQRLAQTGTGALDRIKAAASSAWALIAEPIWEQVFVPLLNSLADASRALIDFVDHARQSKAVTDSWAKTLAVAHNLVGDLNTVLGEHSNLLKLVVEGAILVVLGAVRGMIVVGEILLRVLVGLGGALVWLSRALKPVWDMLRLLSGALKEISFGDALRNAKKWSFDFPNIFWTGLAAAMAVLSKGLPGLIALVIGFLGDLLIEMLPFSDELKETLHQIWDWTLLGGAIGSFFGPAGILIGGLVGTLVGVLDKAMGLPIRTWFEENLPIIFPAMLLAGFVGGLFGGPVGAAIGLGVGALIGWLGTKFDVPVTEWLSTSLPRIFAPALLGGAIGSFFGPVGAVIGAGVGLIIGLLGEFSGFFDEFQTKIGERWSAISTAFLSAFERIGNLLRKYGPELRESFSGLGSALLTLWDSLSGSKGRDAVDTLIMWLEAITGVLVSMLGGVLVGGTRFLTGLVKIVTGAVKIISGFVDWIGGIWDLIVGLLTGNTEKIEAGWERLRDGSLRTVMGMWDVICGIFEASFGTLLGFAEGFAETFLGFFSELTDVLVGRSIVPDLVKDIIGWFGKLPGELGDIGAQSMSGFAGELASPGLPRVPTATSGFAGEIARPGIPGVPAVRGTLAPATATPMVSVTVSGNYILDDATATRLADQVGEKIMSQLSSRWPVTMR